jgi:hypothetical protein
LVVAADSKVQVHPAALPLHLVDLAFAVLLAAGLKASSSTPRSSRCKASRMLRVIVVVPRLGRGSAPDVDLVGSGSQLVLLDQRRGQRSALLYLCLP